MKPRIKRMIENVGCSVTLGIVFAISCWIAFIPYISLYEKIKEVQNEQIRFHKQVEANLF